MKEMKINVKTDDQTSFTTDKIKGILDAIIIDITSDSVDDFYMSNKVKIIIESELGYFILQRSEIDGVNYLVPRARTTTPIEDLKDFPDFQPFNLNKKLIITVIGPKNTEANFILRFL